MAGSAGTGDPGVGAGRRWDVALSFAGAQRDYVGRVAAALKTLGVRCFYDADEQVRLWGTHLAEELPRIYAQESAAVVVFISADYAAGAWTRLERRAAFSRAVAEAGVFVLPARFDDSQMPGLISDVVTVDLRRHTPEQFAALIAAKLTEPNDSPSPQPGGPAAGRLLAGVTDPFDLEVHRAVQAVDIPAAGLLTLPMYVSRDHDRQLAELVQAAAEGASGIAVLVGGSSTGKTRACWEALALLRDQEPEWRLWHPIDPSRPEAALRELPSIGPRTVVWMNEAQLYLDVAAGGLGERVAAGLRQLLRDPARAPVLVLATLWPEFWDRLTARPPAAGADPHAQARELLTGREISVPAAFNAAQIRQLTRAGDPRLTLAAEAAEAGQVAQFLAGAPELMARYRHSPPAAAALITAAIDARRLGMGIALPLAFLEAAAPGYLTDADWDELGEDWLNQALAYTAAPARGIRGPLAGIRPRTTPSTIPAPGPACRLADYLEQRGRRARRAHIPPAGFWTAAARFAPPGDLSALARAADDRGLYRDAARLRKHAAALGDTGEAVTLLERLHSLHRHSSDPNPARWAAARAALGDPYAVALLLGALRKAGADEQVAVLLARDPAAHDVLGDPGGVSGLLRALLEAGADEQVAVLLARDPAARTALDDPFAVASLLGALRKAGADEQVAVLLARDPATQTDLDNPFSAARLLNALRWAGADEQAAALADRAAAHADVDDPSAAAWLLNALGEAGADEQAAALAGRAAAHAALDDPFAVASLLGALRKAGADEQVAVLLARHPAVHDNLVAVAWLVEALHEAGADDPAATLLALDPAAHAALIDPKAVVGLLAAPREMSAYEQAGTLAGRAAAVDGSPAVAWLLNALRLAGADEQAAALLARDPAAHVTLDDPAAVAGLLGALDAAGADDQVAALLARDPAARVTLDDPGAVAWLLGVLRRAGADKQAAALGDRAAAHATLDNPFAVAWLLDALHEAGAAGQTIALADRAAAQTDLDNPEGAARLLHVLREAGADQQANLLVGRLPAEGRFDLFLREAGDEVRFRFGREAGGSPAPPWGWDDLD